MVKPLIVSCFTKDTPYEKEALDLIESCKNFDLEFVIEGFTSLGSWEKNCCYKADFILEKLKQYQKPVLWIDVDGYIVKPLNFFNDLTCDMCAFIDHDLPNDHPSKLRTSTLFCNYSEKSITLIKNWISSCKTSLAAKERSEVWDQAVLRDIALKQTEASILDMPLTYLAIASHLKDASQVKDPHIVHTQASRLYKKYINNELVMFWDNENFPKDELKQIRTDTSI